MMRTFLTALWWQSWWQSSFWCQACSSMSLHGSVGALLKWDWKKFLKYQKIVAGQTYKQLAISCQILHWIC